MAELHIIGQIFDAKDFEEPNLFCKWSIQTSNFWKVIEGQAEGCTCTNRSRFEDKISVFASPIDLHLSCRSIQGWPKLHVEVFSVNGFDNKCHPVGFGFVHIPITPGVHSLTIPTWKVAPNTVLETVQDKFHSAGLSVTKADLIYSGIERYKLRTKTSGTVSVELMLILKNFGKFGVEINQENIGLEINLSKPTTVTVTNVTELGTTESTTATTAITTTIANQVANKTEVTQVENVTMGISTSTPLPTITSQTTPLSNVTSTVATPVLNPFSGFINRREGSHGINYCKCDMQVNICEINCCCDLDCSREVIKLFDCSAEEIDVQDYDYYGNLESCDISGGLLCVTSRKGKKLTSSFYDSSKKYSTELYEWLAVFPQPSVVEKGAIEKYRIGDFLQIFDEKSETISSLKIPQKYIGRNCMINQRITWLQSFKSQCVDLRNVDEVSKWNSIKFLRYPVTASMEFHCTIDTCSNITINFLPSTNDTDFEQTTPLKSIAFFIWHNFTHIQGNVELNVKFATDSNSEFEPTTFQVDFKSVEERSIDFWTTSGSLGYQKQHPVLVAKKVTFTNYTEENKEYVLDFFVFNNHSMPYHANRTFKLPISRFGKCIISEFDTLINFGENLNKKCHVHLKTKTKLNSTNNFNEICLEYQRQIFTYLLHGYDLMQNNFTSLLYVSQLGHPKNHTDHWVHLKFKNQPNPNSNGNEYTSGVWKSDTSDTFMCSNMVISLKYQFYYAVLDVNGIERQNVIKEAEIDFGPRLDLLFKVNDTSVPIFIQTQFHDLTVGLKNNSALLMPSLCLIGILLLLLQKMKTQFLY